MYAEFKASRDEAQLYCNAFGADLVAIESQQENYALKYWAQTKNGKYQIISTFFLNKIILLFYSQVHVLVIYVSLGDIIIKNKCAKLVLASSA